MNDGDEAPGEETGPAVVGRSTYLCWTPCHREPVRLHAGAFEPWMAVVVQCRRCETLWTVQFPTPPPGADPSALWRRLRKGPGGPSEEDG
jgi:hypothetical protein